MPASKGYLRASRVLLLLLALLGTPVHHGWAAGPARAQTVAAPQQTDSLQAIQQYISSGWDRLTRSVAKCETYPDVKSGGSTVLYLPADMESNSELRQLAAHCNVRIERLPVTITKPGEIDPAKIHEQGLLYLPNPYVVPGGQFNEMYGWDSYFIIRGLLRDHREALAKGMVEDFLFEIAHYGGVLNANRTYYLTRSQPPFLTSMILAVYDAEASSGKVDNAWLTRAYDFAVRDYQQWSESPHLAGDTGLSRYFDYGAGPVPEIADDPSRYYRGVARWFLLHPTMNKGELAEADRQPGAHLQLPIFTVFTCDPQTPQPEAENCGPAGRVLLTSEFYKGDRSMRESGFDVTFRFGPYGAQTHHYAPVCLNSLLYKTEIDLERLSALLGRADDSRRWSDKAAQRRERIERYLWDAARGMFFDYDVVADRRSDYEFATTFYPLWAGLASKEQAAEMVRNLNRFEEPGGIVTSLRETGAQWDFPYGWAPIQLLTTEGLRRYGYDSEADRISYQFLSTVLRNFGRDGTIREKYDVVARSAETNIRAGYRQNVIGFGWTNGVFVELLRQLSPEWVSRLRREAGAEWTRMQTAPAEQ